MPFLLSCKKATRLLSESLDRPLAQTERWQLKMHLTICQGCRNYRQQMNFLRQACRQYPLSEVKH